MTEHCEFLCLEAIEKGEKTFFKSTTHNNHTTGGLSSSTPMFNLTCCSAWRLLSEQ